MSSRRRRNESEIEAQGKVFAALPGVGEGLRLFLRRHGLEVRRLQHDGLSSRWHGDDVGAALFHAGLHWNGEALKARQLAKQMYLAQQTPSWQEREARWTAKRQGADIRQGADTAMPETGPRARETAAAVPTIRPEREPARARGDPGPAPGTSDLFDPETLRIRTLALGRCK